MASQKKPNLKGDASQHGAGESIPMSDPKPMPSQGNNTSAPVARAQGSGIMKYALIGIVAIVIIAVVALLLSGSNGAPSQLTGALSQKTLNATALGKVIAQKVNSTPEFTVNYSGSAIINVTTTLAGSESMTIPVVYKFQKYYNDSRTDISLQGVPFVGSMAISSLHINGKNYTCEQGGFGSLGGSTGGGITCMSQAQQPSPLLNETALDNGLNMTINNTAQSTFSGQACTEARGVIRYTEPQLVSGFSQTGQQSPSLNGTFSACFSNKYFVPLTLDVQFTGKNYTVKFHLNETAISATSSKSYVTVLPAPVENTSYITGSTNINVSGNGSGNYGGNGSGNYGGNGNLIGPSCLANVGFLCSGPIMMTNGTFDAIIGQNTGQTMQYVEMACAESTTSQPHGAPYESLDLNGTAWSVGIYNTDLVSGSDVFLKNLQCVDSYGNPIRSLAVGTEVTGALWMRVAANYTDAETNNWNSPQEVGVFNVKVS